MDEHEHRRDYLDEPSNAWRCRCGHYMARAMRKPTNLEALDDSRYPMKPKQVTAPPVSPPERPADEGEQSVRVAGYRCCNPDCVGEFYLRSVIEEASICPICGSRSVSMLVGPFRLSEGEVVGSEATSARIKAKARELVNKILAAPTTAQADAIALTFLRDAQLRGPAGGAPEDALEKSKESTGPSVTRPSAAIRRLLEEWEAEAQRNFAEGRGVAWHQGVMSCVFKLRQVLDALDREADTHKAAVVMQARQTAGEQHEEDTSMGTLTQRQGPHAASACRMDSQGQVVGSEATSALNGWRELGEEMQRVIELMTPEQREDLLPDWFSPRLSALLDQADAPNDSTGVK